MSQNRYPIPHVPKGAWHESVLIVRRSRFIARTAHAPDAVSARAVLEAIRTAWPDATHHCFAFVAGPPGNTAHIGYGDDGEPHGSAGRPMLKVLLHRPVGEIVCVVTRYFGGVKLGVGGLVRAYQGAVQENIATLPVIERVCYIRLHAHIAYAHRDRARRILSDFEARCVREDFDVDTSLYIDVPQERVQACIAALTEATDGAILMNVIEHNTEYT